MKSFFFDFQIFPKVSDFLLSDVSIFKSLIILQHNRGMAKKRMIRIHALSLSIFSLISTSLPSPIAQGNPNIDDFQASQCLLNLVRDEIKELHQKVFYLHDALDRDRIDSDASLSKQYLDRFNETMESLLFNATLIARDLSTSSTLSTMEDYQSIEAINYDIDDPLYFEFRVSCAKPSASGLPFIFLNTFIIHRIIRARLR